MCDTLSYVISMAEPHYVHEPQGTIDNNERTPMTFVYHLNHKHRNYGRATLCTSSAGEMMHAHSTSNPTINPIPVQSNYLHNPGKTLTQYFQSRIFERHTLAPAN